jgi:hypothetical protein
MYLGSAHAADVLLLYHAYRSNVCITAYTCRQYAFMYRATLCRDITFSLFVALGRSSCRLDGSS